MAREIKFGSILTKLIREAGFGGKRKKLCKQIGISTAVLSQYEKDRTRPRFETLVALADVLDVSVDFLLFGDQQIQSQPIDLGPWAGYFDRSLTALHAKTDARSAATVGIARALADRIQEVADDVIQKYCQIGGLLPDDDTMLIEQHSVDTRLLVLRLDYNVSRTHKADGTELVQMDAAGRFLPIVATNLIKGRKYTFILPAGVRDWDNLVYDYRKLLKSLRVSDQAIRNNCRFLCTTMPVVCGCGLYKLDIHSLQADPRTRILYERIRSSVSTDGWIGYVTPPSEELQADALMDEIALKNARRALEQILKNKKATVPM